MKHDAGEIARMLAPHAAAIAAELLPRGRRDGQEWRCGSIAGEPGDSLAVHLSGGKAGVWSDFATGELGDALDLVAHVLYAGDKGEALAWARRWLGLSDTAPAQPRRAPPPPSAAEIDGEAEGRRDAARRIFLASTPHVADTPVAHYLAARGIDLAELRHPPRALRFHARLWNSESRQTWPAMVAAVVRPGAGLVAAHRTWLAKDADGIWRKAPLRDAKKSLGAVRGGLIPLQRGSSGKPLAHAPTGETAVVAEGIETGLSVALACPELRVAAAVSLANLGAIVLPPAVTTVIIAADDDGDNAKARDALDRAVQRLLAEGRTVRIARPPIGKDFNDALMAAQA